MTALDTALHHVTDPQTLLMLLTGVVTGLILGVIPGVGGLFGLVIMVPFTYHLDPYAAIALLLGITAVTTISDTIPAVLIGIPGTIGAIATVEDGHPMAKQGLGARALGAAYAASGVGGIIGAVILLACLPFLTPLVMALKIPDFLAVSVIGMLFVASVSGRDPLKGLGSLLLGMLASYVGLDAISGSERYTFGMIYLWDGLPLAVLFVGLFGLPELTALIGRGRIAHQDAPDAQAGLLDGVRDALHHWRLVLQCSTLGALIGAIPGVGVTVIDWIAYGLARKQTRTGPAFGTGNVAGVIAPEGANNAKEGGYLIPTLALGLPGSVTMTILLAAFTVQGLVPGPQMLIDERPLIYSMVFFIALANVIGVTITALLTRQLTKVALLPTSFIIPVALTFVVVGALRENTDIKDIILLTLAGLLGITMRNRGWSRAAFSLGFVLGPSVERYFFLTKSLYGFEALLRPSILIAALAVAATGLHLLRRKPGTTPQSPSPALSPRGEVISFLGLCLIGAAAFLSLLPLPIEARVFTQIAAISLFGTGLWGIVRTGFAHATTPGHIDRVDQMSGKAILYALAAVWSLTALIYLIDHRLAALLFVAGYVAVAYPARRITGLWIGLGTAVVIHLVFDMLISIDWPDPWVWSLFT